MELVDPDHIDQGRAWVVLFASFMSLFLSCGALYSVSVFNMIFLDVFGASKAATSISGAVLIGLIAMMGPLSSYLTNRFGWRVTVVTGGVIATTGTFLASTSRNITELLIYYGIISGIGHGLVYTAAIVVVGYCFERYRTLASGIASVGAGVGMMTFPPVIQYLYVNYPWRELMVYISCFYAHLCVLGMLMWTPPASGNKQRRKTFNVISVTREDSVLVMMKDHTQSATADANDPDLQLESSHDDVTLDCKDNLKPSSDLNHSPLFTVSLTEDVVSNTFTNYADINCNGNCRGDLEISDDILPPIEHNHCGDFLKQSQKDWQIKTPSMSSLSSSHLCKCTQIGQYFGTCCGYTCHCNDLACPPQLCVSSDLLSKKFFIFCFSIFVFGLGLSALYLHLSAFAISKGASEREASFLVTVLGISSIISRIFTGFAGNDSSIDKSILYIGAFGVAGIATIACPAMGSTYPGRLTFTIVFGFYGSCFNVLLAPLTVELIGLKNLTTAFGIEMVINGIAYFLGPPLAGLLYDCFHSYDTSFFLAGTSLILSSMVMMSVSMYDKESQRTGSGWPVK